MIPLILDHRLRLVDSASGEASPLVLPVGTGSLLDHLTATLSAVAGGNGGQVLVVPTFRYDHEYVERIRSGTQAPVNIVPSHELDSVLSECETGDCLLLVDPARWPLADIDLGSILASRSTYRGATHLIAIGDTDGRAQENVERDGNGRVRKVERLYHGEPWPTVANCGTFLSLVPARWVSGIRVNDLPRLRAALAARGVLSCDLALEIDAVDVTSPEGLLALSECTISADVRRAPRAGFDRIQPQLLAGRGCRIDDSARFFGPVILHDGVVVEPGVTIVGPTVVGAGARIGRDAIVAQSALAAHFEVACGATVCHRVAFGSCSVRVEHEYVRPRQVSFAQAEQWGRRAHLIVKRLIDLVFSLAALMVLSPLMIAAAVLIKLTSPGPILFVHRRERKGQKEFPCLKFRTMTVDAHEQQRGFYKYNEVDGPQFNLQHDPRVTELGHWLRSTNVDELPQLINVLLGHMSLVGPRPSPFRENQICVPWRRARLSVRPGITGLWQLCRSPQRAGGDFQQWIYYDLAYVRHFSVWLDLKILLATVLTMGGRRRVPLSWLIRDGAPVSLGPATAAAA